MTNCCYEWNDVPLQDLLDKDSVGCSYHCLFYLMAKYNTDMTLKEIVHKYYHVDKPKDNDMFAIVYIEYKMSQ